MNPSPDAAAVTAAVTGTVSVGAPVSIGRIRAKVCDVKGCGSDSLRNPELLFVAVPSHNYPERRFVWLALMQAVRDKKRSYCCSRHFTVPDDFKDFQQFISAPPGYKRQLMVNKGVVPHLNMPPLALSGLPPLTGRWQINLPDSVRQNQPAETSPMTINRSMARGLNVYERHVPRYCKAVQTDSQPMILSGPRKVKPSLQYCRLCFQRQDLEPIFTGDQTLIEPDLIDKIYGCTEVMISVQYDFPSSICTSCYGNIQNFIKFRKMVQRNDQSLRASLAQPKLMPSVHQSPFRPSPSVSFKPAGLMPNVRPLGRSDTTLKNVTVGSRLNASLNDNQPRFRPAVCAPKPRLKFTPTRPTQHSPATGVSRPVIRQNSYPEDELLEVTHVEDVQTYEKRRRALETSLARTPLPQATRLPVTAKSSNNAETDPFQNVNTTQFTNNGSNLTPSGVQMKDRVVPVTLIRVMPEEADPHADVELQIPQSDNHDKQSEMNENKSLSTNENESNKIGFLQPKPIEELTENANKKLDAPNVLQAVKLVPASAVKAITKARPQGVFLRPAGSKGLNMFRGLKQLGATNKSPSLPPTGSPLSRAVKFPGTLTTLFSRTKKAFKSSSEILKLAEKDTPNNVPQPPVSVEKTKVSKPVSIPKVPEKSQVLEEVIPSKEATVVLPKLNPATVNTAVSIQKENDVPESPSSMLENDEPRTTDVSTSLQRTSRIRKVPLRLQDSICFPMPKIITIKTEPSDDSDSKQKSPTVIEKSVSDLEPVKKPHIQDQKNTAQAKTNSEENHKQTNKQEVIRNRVITRRSELGVPIVVTKKLNIEEIQQKTAEVKKGADEKSKPIKEVQQTTELINRVKTRRSDPEVKGSNVESISKPTPPQTAQVSRQLKRKSLPNVKPEPTIPRKSPKMQTKAPAPVKSDQQQQQQQQGQKDSIRSNGSRKSAPAMIAAKAKKTPVVDKPVPTAVDHSQDWKCPFCPDRMFDQKKGLVRHLRKRHGMDYALVRQRLAIYGGNWR
ncbi:uncharacterized protein LOC129721679 [Wyeomyia smithii]|uniref:uncharacterized protein LOC129721679 n=1 Tax=Wyeomyia smithii TaxID=174621 RepID=UPI0024680FC4|nr:uncharacterized protein LOC129721679 [Wyeomyia smithii]